MRAQGGKRSVPHGAAAGERAGTSSPDGPTLSSRSHAVSWISRSGGAGAGRRRPELGVAQPSAIPENHRGGDPVHEHSRVRCQAHQPLPRWRLRLQARPRRAREDHRGHGGRPHASGPAGGGRDQRRRRRLSHQRHAGHRGHDRLLHADRRRSVRLRRHRRHQRHLRRLRHGRHPALRPGAGRHADRQAAGRDDPPHPRGRPVGVQAGRHPGGRRPQRRLGRGDLRPGRHRARRSRGTSSATPPPGPATRSCSASRSASASTAPPTSRTS